MKIVFFGSANFAVPSLRALLTTAHKISCVVTQPDKKKGRGMALAGTAVKEIAKESKLKFYQPQQLNTAQSVSVLKELNPDLFVVIAYGQILSQQILDIPKILAINVHASILPKYRGAAPINWTIINADKASGITIMKMVKEMDAGPIIMQQPADVSENETAISLEDKLSHLAAELLLVSLTAIEDNNYKLIPQENNQVSFAPKLKKDDGRIDWNKSTYVISSLIKGCLPWPGAFTCYQGKLLKIYKAETALSEGPEVRRPAGIITQVSKTGIVVATGKDDLIIKELQIEGKRKMTVEEFSAGNKISVGEELK